MKNESDYMLAQCYHCGNKGLLEIVAHHEEISDEPILDNFGNVVDFSMDEKYNWLLLSCPVCKKVSLVQKYFDCIMEDMGQTEEIKLLYPECDVNYLGVPYEIRSAFEAALKVKNIDTSICLLSLRRVLEAICKEQGAKGNDLNSMIKNMIENRKLPEMMNDACWIIRQLGNNAAHAGKISVYKTDVEQTINFLKTIIQYLYTLPVQMEQLKIKIETRNEKEKKIEEK